MFHYDYQDPYLTQGAKGFIGLIIVAMLAIARRGRKKIETVHGEFGGHE